MPFNLDSWDGYPAGRERLYQTFRTAGVQPIVLAGDSHAFWVNELYDNAGQQRAVEFAYRQRIHRAQVERHVMGLGGFLDQVGGDGAHLRRVAGEAAGLQLAFVVGFDGHESGLRTDGSDKTSPSLDSRRPASRRRRPRAGVGRAETDIGLQHAFNRRREAADKIGLANVLADIERFHAEFGVWWQPSALLQKLVHEGKTFADLSH
mgnify:CR=1 FL=1